jgi:long-subunit acyl-CoA synthetase (AMP-forming)
MITRRNLTAKIHSLDQVRPPSGYDTDNLVGFLPFSHIDEWGMMYITARKKGLIITSGGKSCLTLPGSGNRFCLYFREVQDEIS